MSDSHRPLRQRRADLEDEDVDDDDNPETVDSDVEDDMEDEDHDEDDEDDQGSSESDFEDSAVESTKRKQTTSKPLSAKSNSNSSSPQNVRTGVRFSDRSTRRIVNYATIEHQLDKVLDKVEEDEERERKSAAKKRPPVISSDSDDDNDDDEEDDDDQDEDDDDVDDSSDVDITDGSLPDKAIRSSSAMVTGSMSNVSQDDITIEKIMDYRPPKMTSADAFLAGALGEFFVKFKMQSYRHCTWVSAADIEKEKTGRQKIQRFLAKWKPNGRTAALPDDEGDDDVVAVLDQLDDEVTTQRHHFGGMTATEEEEEEEGKEGEKTESMPALPTLPSVASHPLSRFDVKKDTFNPDYLVIDRVLDEQVVEEDSFTDDDEDVKVPNSHRRRTARVHMVKYFFCKWVALPYDEATWEKESDLDSAADLLAIHQFRARQTPLSDAELARRTHWKRPGKEAWKKYDVSPDYPHGHQLRPYQMEGLNWLRFCWYHRQNSILADEMGLGKTVQSVTLLNSLYSDAGLRGAPFLVIAPLSTIPHWEREFSHWTTMNVIVYHGSAAARHLITDYEFYHYAAATGSRIKGVYKFDVLITTYEMILAAAGSLKAIPWRVVVIDEAHRLKNRQSKILEVLKGFSMEHRVLLTGTPLQNNLEELWTLLNFLEPARFQSERDFMVQFGQLQSDQDVAKLQALLVPLMLRRLKADVETSIPVKEETIIEVELTTFQKKYYRAILEKNFTFLVRGSGRKQNMPNLINTMMELRKCCIHPYLIQGAEEVLVHDATADTHDKQFELMIQASGKLVLVDKLLPKLKAGGHKVLIFSQMTRCLDLLEDYMRGRAYRYERIDGAVKGDQRQAAIDRFSRRNADSFVFLLCTKAGGVGINLTAADTVVIFDSDWNPQNDLQAQARCHRIGQEKPVKVYRLITRNTYEREMFDRASLKLGLDKAILQKIGEQHNSSSGAASPATSTASGTALSKKEVEELLKKGAYGALMEDDTAASKFCEEDIDQILERRTIVIQHDQSAEKNSFFSKATFTAAGAAVNVDLHDPQFWEKWAKEAHLDTSQLLLDESAELILDAPRQRKQVQRFRADDGDLPAVAGNDPLATGKQVTSSLSHPLLEERPLAALLQKTPGGARGWSHAERVRLEKYLMVHGYGQWQQIGEAAHLLKRSPQDIEACCQVLLRIAYEGLMEEINERPLAVIATGQKETASLRGKRGHQRGRPKKSDKEEEVAIIETEEEEEENGSESEEENEEESESDEDDDEEEDDDIDNDDNENDDLLEKDSVDLSAEWQRKKMQRKKEKLNRLDKHHRVLVLFAEQLLALRERQDQRVTRRAEKEASLRSLESELLAQQQSLLNGQDLLDLLNARWTEQDKETMAAAANHGGHSRRRDNSHSAASQNQARLLQMQQMMRTVQQRIQRLTEEKEVFSWADELPYAECSERQLIEYRSFHEEMKEEQVANLKRRARLVFQRMQFFHVLRNEILPRMSLLVWPVMNASKPTSWWTRDDDMDLLRGIARHGYQQYESMVMDTTLGFHAKVDLSMKEGKRKRKRAQNEEEEEGDAVAMEKGEGEEEEEEEELEEEEEEEEELELEDELEDDLEEELEEEESDVKIESEVKIESDVKKEPLHSTMTEDPSLLSVTDTQHVLPSHDSTLPIKTEQDTLSLSLSSTIKLPWAGNTPLNLRVKRIMNALMRQLKPKRRKLLALHRSPSDALMATGGSASAALLTAFLQDYDPHQTLDVFQMDRRLSQRLVEKYVRSEAATLVVRLDGRRKRASKKELKQLNALLNWSKQEKSLFIKTLSTYGVHFSQRAEFDTEAAQRQASLDALTDVTLHHFEWTAFLQVSGLEAKPDVFFEKYLAFILKRSDQLMTGEVVENDDAMDESATAITDTSMVVVEDDDPQKTPVSSSFTAQTPPVKEGKRRGRKRLVENLARKRYEKDVVTRDRAERIMFRLPILHVVRHQLLAAAASHAMDVDALLERALRLPTEESVASFWSEHLPVWWRAGCHDAALLRAIAKHGFNRNDAILKDDAFPFLHDVYGPALQLPVGASTERMAAKEKEFFGNIHIGGGENAGGVMAARLGWPRDRVIYTRIFYLLRQLNALAEREGESHVLSPLSNPMYVYQRLAASEETTSRREGQSDPAGSQPSSAGTTAVIRRQRVQVPWAHSVEAYDTFMLQHTPAAFGVASRRQRREGYHGNDGEEGGRAASSSSQPHSAQRQSRRGASGLTPSMLSRRRRARHDVERDLHGQPIFPICIGNLTIYALGEISLREGFHSDKYLWPVGFHSSKDYASVRDPLRERWQYHSRILDGGEGPLFEVTVAEDPTFRVCEKSATSAWVRIVRAVQDKKRRLQEKRKQRRDGEEKAASETGTPTEDVDGLPLEGESRASVSGPEYFGYALPSIMKLLQELPQAEACRKYVMQTFGYLGEEEEEEGEGEESLDVEGNEQQSRQPLRENAAGGARHPLQQETSGSLLGKRAAAGGKKRAVSGARGKKRVTSKASGTRRAEGNANPMLLHPHKEEDLRAEPEEDDDGEFSTSKKKRKRRVAAPNERRMSSRARRKVERGPEFISEETDDYYLEEDDDEEGEKVKQSGDAGLQRHPLSVLREAMRDDSASDDQETSAFVRMLEASGSKAERCDRIRDFMRLKRETSEGEKRLETAHAVEEDTEMMHVNGEEIKQEEEKLTASVMNAEAVMHAATG